MTMDQLDALGATDKTAGGSADIGGRPTDVRAKFREVEGQFLFTGVQAMVRVPLDVLRDDRRAGLHTAGFVSGFPGSPVGTLDIELSRISEITKELNLVFAPGVNEELALTSVMGSQLVPTFPTAKFAGVLGLWYGKAPGLDRASDALRHASFLGTTRYGGAIAVVGDDPAAKSSTLPSSSEHTLHDLLVPTFTPGTVQEVIDLGVHAAALSRGAGLWSAMRLVTAVADGTGSAVVGPGRITPVVPTLERDGEVWRPSPQGGYMAYQSPDAEREIVEIRMRLALQYAVENPGVNEITVNPAAAWCGIVASGRTYYEIVEALRVLGLERTDLNAFGVRLLRLGLVSPLDPAIVRRFAEGLEEIIVVEDGRQFLEIFVKDALYGSANTPHVIGQRDEMGGTFLPGFGSPRADTLVGPLARRLQKRVPSDRLRLPKPPRPRIELADLPNRKAHFCSGCPHSTGTKVPAGSLVGAGIGCHGMVAFMDPERVGTVVGITQMGGEGAQWIGIEPFVTAEHLVQNLGDGTLFHSGSLAIRAAIAAESNITYKILYNNAVAMTGGQPARGAIPVPQLARELLLEGVKQVIITTDEPKKYRGTRIGPEIEVWPREQIIEAQEVLSKVKGVTVLIHDQQCAAEKRRDRKRGRAPAGPFRVVINDRVCEGCGDCGAVSNCLSVQPIETEFGRKTRIDQTSCNLDFSCLAGDCPSFLTVEQPARRRLGRFVRGRGSVSDSKQISTATPSLGPGDVPEPVRIVPAASTTVRMPGIGGTGVVTVSQILGTAAVLDGKHVQGLDQTGFSQKAGAVVSDLRITAAPVEGTNQLTESTVDVYLVFDLLVALDDKNIVGSDPRRTVAVVSTSPTATGAMVIDVNSRYPDTQAMLGELAKVTRSDCNVVLDAAAVSRRLFGDSTTANVLLVGAAYQRGCLPMSAAAIEEAIDLNGAATEANKQAFRWGRMLVHDPAQLGVLDLPSGPETALECSVAIDDLDVGELGRLLRIRIPELISYQNSKLALTYVDLVRLVAVAERSVDATSTRLAEAVARQYFKLLAYKDEYEVARLHAQETQEIVSNQIAGNVRISYNLHPPILRALGMTKKIRLGPWAGGMFEMLAKGKCLRGTRLDPFGYARVRRIERQLIDEYRETIEDLSRRLDTTGLRAAIEIAELPDLIRGYESIKLDNVDRYHEELRRLDRMSRD